MVVVVDGKKRKKGIKQTQGLLTGCFQNFQAQLNTTELIYSFLEGPGLKSAKGPSIYIPLVWLVKLGI